MAERVPRFYGKPITAMPTPVLFRMLGAAIEFPGRWTDEERAWLLAEVARRLSEVRGG